MAVDLGSRGIGTSTGQALARPETTTLNKSTLGTSVVRVSTERSSQGSRQTGFHIPGSNCDSSEAKTVALDIGSLVGSWSASTEFQASDEQPTAVRTIQSRKKANPCFRGRLRPVEERITDTENDEMTATTMNGKNDIHPQRKFRQFYMGVCHFRRPTTKNGQSCL